MATAIPAFIGYTPKATFQGKSCLNKPVKVNSFADFKSIFCLDDPPAPQPPAKQYDPHYYLVEQNGGSGGQNILTVNGKTYAVLPDPNTVYYLYNSVRLFYNNGGGDAYIVAVGNYGPASGKPLGAGAPLVNPNVSLNDLLNGIKALKKEPEPTMYICPEATLLSIAENGNLMQAMLLQNESMRTAISIFDIIGAKDPDPLLYTNDIQNFRTNTGVNGLGFGVAYYPFVGTTIMQAEELDYNNFFGGDTGKLKTILSPVSAPDQAIETIFQEIEDPNSNLNHTQLQKALLSASPVYANIMQKVREDVNLLPPSGGMAGVMTMIDNQEGVWKAPANVSMVSVANLPINLNEGQQATLNVDAVSGKSINALRKFAGLGILVWGARTLDGNSNDYRYVPVRRTLIFIEQSLKLAIEPYVFEPNDQNTWKSIIAVCENFLNDLWRRGGLVGAKPNDAFAVKCGLGTTMTAQDILEGNLYVSIQIALTHPAEFIILNLHQKMTS